MRTSQPLSHIPREIAAELLKISVRTLDRYIRRGFLRAERFDRNVFIPRPSFERYYQKKARRGFLPPLSKLRAGEGANSGNISEGNANRSRIESSTDIRILRVSGQEVSEAETRFSCSRDKRRVEDGRGYGRDHERGEWRDEGMYEKPDDGNDTSSAKFTSHEHDYELKPVAIYKNLYDELKAKYEEQQRRMEGAHYRVGQLEAELKNMVPLLEVKQERKRFLIMDRNYKATLEEARVRVIRTKRLVLDERYNKAIYIALVYILLALQPLFWVLSGK